MTYEPDDDAAIDEMVEAAIDAADERSSPMWRHRARGGTVAQLVGGARRRASIQLHPPQREMEMIAQCAAVRGLTPIRYVRQCVATSMVEEHGLDPDDMPWMTRDGLLP